MMDRFFEIWNFVVFTTSGGDSVHVGQLVQVLLLVFFGYFASRLVSFVMGRRLARTVLGADGSYTVQRVVFFALLILVAISALSLLRVPLTAFAFATGAIAIGVGFGAQNIVNNFISGWILMAERPIRIGDFVEVGGANGTVERIGTRSTRIRRVDGVHLLVPNSKLLEETVINWTLVDREIRARVSVGVAYGSPVRKVAELLDEIVCSHESIKEKPRPIVVFEDFGDSSLLFEAYFWCDVGGERELRAIRSDLRFRIDEVFAQNGIVIAFPQRDVHIDLLKPIDVRVVPEGDARAKP
jgi:small-conductance mechanosensitive channel